MIRKDRQITDLADFLHVLDSCKVCRIALQTGGAPYIVPMNYAYACTDTGKLVLYFHCRLQGGQKLELLGKNPAVGFELDCDHSLITGDIACLYGYTFSSIVGTGQMDEITDLPEKQRILAQFMKHQTGKDFEIREVEAKCVGVWQLVSEDFTGKHCLARKP